MVFIRMLQLPFYFLNKSQGQSVFDWCPDVASGLDVCLDPTYCSSSWRSYEVALRTVQKVKIFFMLYYVDNAMITWQKEKK
ncbi:MAG: hypothetical protein WAU01_08940 [Saprospiraceae bacterium]